MLLQHADWCRHGALCLCRCCALLLCGAANVLLLCAAGFFLQVQLSVYFFERAVLAVKLYFLLA